MPHRTPTCPVLIGVLKAQTSICKRMVVEEGVAMNQAPELTAWCFKRGRHGGMVIDEDGDMHNTSDRVAV